MSSSFVRDREEKATWELNLAPMLDMLVSLVTILLMAFTTIRIGLIDTALPQPVAKAMEEDKNKKDREISFVLDMNARRDMVLKTKMKDGSERKTHIPNKGGEFDVERLHKEAVQLKVQHSTIFRMELMPDEALGYKDIIKVMDQLRMVKKEDPKVNIKDEKTGEMVATTIMFSDLVFGNVVGE